MQDVVRQSGSFCEKFIFTKVVEGRQVLRAVAMATVERSFVAKCLYRTEI